MDPRKYQRGYSFSGYQATNPKQPLPGPRVDDELENIEQALNGAVDAVKDIRRADGKLQNGSVGPDQLSAALSLGFTMRGTWAAGTAYSGGDGVAFGNALYAARVAHTATAEATPDVAIDLWRFLFSLAEVVLPDAVTNIAQYPSRAALAAAPVPAVAVAVTLAGYHTAGDGGGARYKRIAAPGAPKAWQVQSADGTWWDLAEPKPNLFMFGAKGDGSDDTAAFQAAAAYSDALGGIEIIVPQPKTLYTISQTIISHRATLFRAHRGDLSNNPNGASWENATFITSTPTIRWVGAVDELMFYWIPVVTGDNIFGGGIIGVELDGNTTAAIGAQLDSTKFAEVDLKVRNVRYAGLVTASDKSVAGNFSSHNTINLEFVWGVAAECQNAHGYVSRGNVAGTIAATQHRIGQITGLVYNGSLVQISNTDNLQARSIHGVVQAGGTGCAIELTNTGVNPSHHNVFGYVVGPVRMDTGLKGNKFEQYNSEAGGISTVNGGAGYHAEMVDYVTGKLFKTQFYLMKDELPLPSGTLIPFSPAIFDSAALTWPTIVMPGSATSYVGSSTPSPRTWGDGRITGIKLHYSTEGTVAAGLNARFNIVAVTAGNTSSVVNVESNQAYTVAVPNAVYWKSTATLTFTTPLAFTEGDLIGLRIHRDTAHAEDNANSVDLRILGVSIMFEGTGPDSPGSGTYAVPN